jgi:hypothetical protein
VLGVYDMELPTYFILRDAVVEWSISLILSHLCLCLVVFVDCCLVLGVNYMGLLTYFILWDAVAEWSISLILRHLCLCLVVFC